MAVLEGDALVEWVRRSCPGQGLPLKVTDERVVDKVRIRLRGSPVAPAGGARPGGPAADRSQAPPDLHPLGVKTSGATLAWVDDDVVDDGVDDGSLASEVQCRPLSA